MNKTDIANQYGTNKLIAILSEFPKQTIGKIEINNEEKSQINIIVQLAVYLIPGGVEVVYNPDVIKFDTLKDKELFQREINEFFISKGFLLGSIVKKVNVYICGTKLNSEPRNYYFQDNNSILEDGENNQLMEIISKVIINSLKGL